MVGGVSMRFKWRPYNTCTVGDRLMRGHGLAFVDHPRRVFVTVVWPFNHAVGAARWVWYKVRDCYDGDDPRSAGGCGRGECR